MKIAFDGQPLLEVEKTGIGYYTHGLIKNITSNFSNEKYYLNIFAYRRKEFAEKVLATNNFKNTQIEVCDKIPLSLYKAMWNFIPLPYKFLFQNKPDVTHFFNYYIPPYVYGKAVCTIHDMTIKAYPETVKIKTRIMMALGLKKTCKRATAIITSSEFSKNEIIKYMKIDSRKIHVLYSGVDLEFYKPCYDIDLLQAIKKKFNILNSYFLYLGTLEPRKNISRVILAYAQLVKEKGDLPQLVIAGKRGWMYDDIFKTVKENQLNDKVIFTDYVSKEDAPLLMSGAVAFIFPSLYEGFGMPPLEAMACGTPVITSNTSSLPEVVGDAAIKVDPYNIDEIANAMRLLHEGIELRDHYSRKGIERAKLFSWDKISESLYEIYANI